MRVNAEGVRLIRQWEGCRLKAYRCKAGVWTVGFGHTGKDVFEGMQITQDTAELVLDSDIRTISDTLSTYVRRPATPNQWAAMVSLAFNAGPYRIGKSTLVRLFNENNLAEYDQERQVVGGAAFEFLSWRFIHGQPDEGLLRRRHAEMDLFLRGLQLAPVVG